MTALTSTDTPRRPTGLVAAFLVALVLHGTVLAVLMVLHLAPPAPVGEQQVTVDLAPVMTEAETQAPAEQQASAEAPPETKPVEEPVEEAMQPPPPTETAETPPEAVEAVEPPKEVQAVEPQSQVITSTAERAEPLAAPPPEVAKTPVAEPDPAKLKAEREARLRKIREEKRREEARQERLEEIKEAREAKLKAEREARTKASKAREGAARDSAAASRQSTAGRAAAGNDPGAMAQWKGAISSAIHGRMNSNAAAGTSGGTAVVRFVVLRSGQVVSAGLSSSSGVGQIDSAALSAVRGSMPAAPSGVSVPSLAVTIPLKFVVR
jgi:protein TonB